MPEENKPSPRFLTIDQAATELNIGRPLVRGLLKSGELRGFQLGGRGYLAQPIGTVQCFAGIQGGRGADGGDLFVKGS